MSEVLDVVHGYIATDLLGDDGTFPNNGTYPLIVYKSVLHLHPTAEPADIRSLFEKNGWTNGWVNGVFDYHHYHSNTHEVLGVFCGKADILFGGDEGSVVELYRGDVVVIPAGVAHKNLNSTEDFECVGAYPFGAEYDMRYGKPEERAAALEAISKVRLPGKDPVFGDEGAVVDYWLKKG